MGEGPAAGEEPLPAFWQTVGTTGYDALATIDRVLVDPAGRLPLSDLDAGLRAEDTEAAPRRLDWHALIRRTKRRIADTILHGAEQTLGGLGELAFINVMFWIEQ